MALFYVVTMKRVVFALVLLLFAGYASALSVSAPDKIAANMAFAVSVEFDSLSGFSDAVVQIDGSTVLSLETVGGSKLYVTSVEESRVLNLSEGETINGAIMNLLLSGFTASGDRTVKVEEIGVTQTTATVNVFVPVSEDFEKLYQQEFNSLKATIMSYANDIDGLKKQFVDLEAMVDGKVSEAEIQAKINEINSSISGMQTGLGDSAEQALENAALIGDLEEKVGELEQETEEFTSTGFISLGNIAKPENLGIVVLGAIIVAVVLLGLAGKLPTPKMPKLKLGSREKTIYRPSNDDKAITSQVLDDAAASNEPENVGKWAFKGGSWKPDASEEKEEKGSSLGDLIKKESP